jgi:hypothetical protein
MSFSQDNKISDYLVGIIFLLALSIPLAGSIIHPDNKMSRVEKRALESAPELPGSKKQLRRYPDKFDTYYEDQFGFRENLLQVYYRLKYMAGDSASSQVFFGKDGWMFFRGPDDLDLVNVTRNLRVLTESELKQHARSLQAKHDWLADRGIAYVFVIAPNKHSIYPEYLPDYMYKAGDRSLTDNFVDYMREHTDVMILDLRAALLREKSAENQLYYRTDTHWNYPGANIGQYEIAQTLAALFPGRIIPTMYDTTSFTRTIEPGGDLAELLALSEDFTEIQLTPAFPDCPQVLLSKRLANRKYFSTDCNASGLNMLVFRDSFTRWLQPYLSHYANRATFVWNRMHPDLYEQALEVIKPDVVIETLAERVLIRTQGLDDNAWSGKAGAYH